MSASRFVGPFMEKVQKWEKSLSHISEVVDVSNSCTCTVHVIGMENQLANSLP